ncbi:MAG: Crp/Fnr family transcriptional regulator [Acidimicrobiia bacterium]
MTDAAHPPEDPDRARRLLESHQFSRGLDPDEIAVLAESATLSDFDAGAVIFEAGDTADTFYLVRSGLVALRVDTGGTVPRTIQQIAEGSALGWSWLFEPYIWQFSAAAITPVRTISIDAPQLRASFEANPACGYHVLERVSHIMAERLNATRHQVLNLVR